jgi:membrane protein
MKSFFRSLPSLLRETASEWSADNAMRLAAALAYYTVFSLAPLLLAAISISGLLWGGEAASGKIYEELSRAVGPSVASAVQEMVASARQPVTGLLGTLFAFALALFGASGVFGELMSSLNIIWGSKAAPRTGILGWIRGRFLSIGMVMGSCFLLLVSMVISSLLAGLGSFGMQHLPMVPLLLQVVHQLLSLGLITLLFSAMFKYLPFTSIQWRDVWVGGAFTAVLFTLGKLGLEQYVARAAPGSSFGAASALALVWVYYSAQIFLFGAEFTEVYARRFGSRLGTQAPREREAPALPGLGDEGSPALPALALRGQTSGTRARAPSGWLVTTALLGVLWLAGRPDRR